MAKSCSTLITLFCFFTLSLASHAPPDNDEASTTQAALVNPNEQVNSEKRYNTFVIPSATLTKIPFRAINRHFSVRSKFPCHHHRKVRPTTTKYGNDVIFPTGENSDFEAPMMVYGGGRRVSGKWLRLRHHHRHQNHGEDSNSNDDANDVIFPTGENSDFEAPVMVYGGGRRVSGRWLRLRHHHRHQNHDEDSNSNDDSDDEDRIKKAAFKRHQVYDRFDKEEELKGMKKMKQNFRLQNGEGVMKKKMKEGGLMRSVRKFLDQYI